MSVIVAAPIAAQRLDLVPLRVAHADEMTAVLADPKLYTYTGGSPPTPAALRTRYERLVAGSPDPTVYWCNWVIRLRGPACLAGTVQATIHTDADQPTAEIAWVVGTSWQRQGIATEAARALVDWLRRLPIHTVIAHVHPDHHASAAVAAAAGLVRTDRWQDGERRWHLTSHDHEGS